MLSNSISSTPFEQLLNGITDHTRRFRPIIRAVMDSSWWFWLLKNTTESFPFLLLLSSSLLMEAGSSPPLPLPHFAPKSSQLHTLLCYLARLAIIHFQHNPADYEPRYSFSNLFSCQCESMPRIIIWPWYLHPSNIDKVYSWFVVDFIWPGHITLLMFCSFFVSLSIFLIYLFLSFLDCLPFVSIIVTEVPRNEVFQYLWYQSLHAVSTLNTIRKSLILISSQVVTLMAVLDSLDSKVISTMLSIPADLLLLAFFPSFSCLYQ